MSTPSSVVLHDVSFHWPDGDSVLSHVSGAFAARRTGLVGANGAGKTTLLRLVAGDLRPTSGSIATTGSVDWLRQGVARGSRTVADLLGITTVREALRAVEAGSTDPGAFDAIGDDWDIEDRARARLSALGLPADLDRVAASLSGGEAMLTAITGVRLRAADIALLDEPTNNLDVDARARLRDVVSDWRGTLIVVSHDTRLLDLLDDTAELRSSELTTFGGPHAAYRDWLAAQQAAAAQSLRSAEQVLNRERRERAKAEERIAHSERQGRKDRANRRYVGAVVNDRRNSAEKAQGSRRGTADAKVAAAREAVARAEHEVRADARITVDLPDPGVPRGRRLADVRGDDGRGLTIHGPERVGLIGPNGVGKTTLLERMLPGVAVQVGYLPQRVIWDDTTTVLDLVRASAPGVSPAELRNRLARLLIRGDMVDRAVGTLSGGERFRVALARLLLADPPPQLLVLDEPTNDLDRESVDQLVAALTSYAGALVVVSHDLDLLRRLQLDHVVRLDERGNLRAAELAG